MKIGRDLCNKIESGESINQKNWKLKKTYFKLKTDKIVRKIRT